MSDTRQNRFRAALEILQKGRDLLVDDLSDQILDQADDLVESGFAFNEFLETQGTRLHFLGLLMAQLEQSAEALEETQISEPPPPPEAPKPRRRRSRAKKLPRQASQESSTDEP
jgi:hypothetical protein